MSTADGRSGVATPTTQMTSSAVCALMMLALRLDAAVLAAAANVARVRGMAVILSDPDGDVIPAGRFVHDRHHKRDT